MKLDDVRALAATLPSRHIVGEDGTPHLSRYKLHGWMPADQVITPCSVYLHNIHRADLDEALHSHPWEWSQTTVLHGGYRQTYGHIRADGRLLLAGLLAIVAVIWNRAGFGAASAVFAVFLSAYMIGRWHAGKAWKRDLELVNEYWRNKRDGE